jgi:hypothetical protein
MNMKKIMMTALAIAVSFGAFAQRQPLGYGLKAGVAFPNYNFSGSNSSYSTDAATNFNVTAFLDAPIVSNYLYVQPGVSLQGKGAKLIDGAIERTQNTMWLEVPVNFVFKAPTGNVGSLFVGAGPYVGFGLSGKDKTSTGNVSGSTDVSFGKDKDLKSTDFGVNFIGGYQLNNGLMIHAGYGLGLTDIRGSNNSYFNDNNLTNRVWTVGVGFAL